MQLRSVAEAQSHGEATGDHLNEAALCAASMLSVLVDGGQLGTAEDLRYAPGANPVPRATGHSNFEESTEAVVTLECADCGKPCRSETEQDLHTKRTGHSSFRDKARNLVACRAL